MRHYLLFVLFLVMPVYGHALDEPFVYGLQQTVLVKKATATSINTGVGVANFRMTDDDNLYTEKCSYQKTILYFSDKLSASGNVSVNNYTNLFGRIGMYNYQIERFTRNHPSKDNVVLFYGDAGKMTTPVVSVGVEAKPFQNFSFHMEYQKTTAISVGSVAVIYKF